MVPFGVRWYLKITHVSSIVCMCMHFHVFVMLCYIVDIIYLQCSSWIRYVRIWYPVTYIVCLIKTNYTNIENNTSLVITGTDWSNIIIMTTKKNYHLVNVWNRRRPLLLVGLTAIVMSPCM